MSTRGEETGTSHGFDTSRPVGSFFEVVREVFLNPRGFFAGVDSAGGGLAGRQRAIVIFAIICSYVTLPLVVLSGPVNSRIDPFAPDDAAPFGGFFESFRENPGLGLALAAVFLVALPLLVIVGAYIGTFVQHLFVMLFVRDRRDYYATFPAAIYASQALGLFSWIPILGYLVGLYGVYVTTVGIRQMHATTTGRALLAALGPYVPLLLLTLPAILAAPAGPQ